MKTKLLQMRRFMVLTLMASVATAVWAGCRDDCAIDLKAALEACEVNYANDPVNLKDCRESAQREYQACLGDCHG